MARTYQNFVGGETDASLTDVATSLSSPALAGMQAVASPDTMLIVLDPDGIAGEPEVVEVTAHTASATTATITRGAEGSTARAHASGIEWIHGPLASDVTPKHKHGLQTGGTETITSSTWANLSLIAEQELTNARAGDTIAVSMSHQWSNEAEYGFLDVATLTGTGGAVVNTFSTHGAESGTSQGISCWFGDTGVAGYAGGVVHYTLQAADIVSGSVFLQWRKRNNAGGVKSLLASAIKPIHWSVQNLGRAQA